MCHTQTLGNQLLQNLALCIGRSLALVQAAHQVAAANVLAIDFGQIVRAVAIAVGRYAETDE